MSGDVQPRKRKDKRRKKDDTPGIEEPAAHASNFTSEENFHIHKDVGTGGNACAKIVFFMLLGALAIMIGLILTEYRGLSDLDTPVAESKWAQVFDGWVDEGPEKHDEHDEPGADDHDEHDEHEEGEHSEEEDHDEEEEEEEEEEHEEEGVSEEEEAPEAETAEGEEDEEEKQDEEGEEDEDEGEEDEDEDEDEEVDGGGIAEESEEAELVDIPGVTGEDDDDNEGEDDDDDDQEDDEGEEDDDNDEDDGDQDNEVEGTSRGHAGGVHKSAADDDDDDDQEGDDDGDEQDDDDEPSGGPDDSGEQMLRDEPIFSDSKDQTESEEQDYLNDDITNEDDMRFHEDLDMADEASDERPEESLHMFTSLLVKHPTSPRARYGKALALDRLADKKRSNTLLQEAIDAYENVIALGSSVPDKLFLQAADRCINRMRFKGQHHRAIHAHKKLTERFKENPDHANQLAVTYLMINRLTEAKRVLEDTLKQWPNNGFAQAHYGFILKSGDNNYKDAVEYLSRGIASREPGTIDGRFFFQLGDALTRLGRHEEAVQVYDQGVKEGLFLSKYQRSLYNVNRLLAQPWWTPNDTAYSEHFQKLLDNWQQIRAEGLGVLANKMYKDEAENLRETGDWKQFELFARDKHHLQ